MIANTLLYQAAYNATLVKNAWDTSLAPSRKTQNGMNPIGSLASLVDSHQPLQHQTDNLDSNTTTDSINSSAHATHRNRPPFPATEYPLITNIAFLRPFTSPAYESQSPTSPLGLLTETASSSPSISMASGLLLANLAFGYPNLTGYPTDNMFEYEAAASRYDAMFNQSFAGMRQVPSPPLTPMGGGNIFGVSSDRPHACPMCNRAFKRSSDLRRHERTVHTKQNLSCCNITFAASV